MWWWNLKTHETQEAQTQFIQGLVDIQVMISENRSHLLSNKTYNTARAVPRCTKHDVILFGKFKTPDTNRSQTCSKKWLKKIEQLNKKIVELKINIDLKSQFGDFKKKLSRKRDIRTPVHPAEVMEQATMSTSAFSTGSFNADGDKDEKLCEENMQLQQQQMSISTSNKHAILTVISGDNYCGEQLRGQPLSGPRFPASSYQRINKGRGSNQDLIKCQSWTNISLLCVSHQK